MTGARGRAIERAVADQLGIEVTETTTDELRKAAGSGADADLEDEVAVARFVTEVGNIPQPTAGDAEGRFPFGPWLGQPTSLDVASDGRSALVLTYGAAYVFRRASDEGWDAAFSRLPERVALPALPGAEAIGYAPRGSSFFVTSERRPAPLYRIDPRPGR